MRLNKDIAISTPKVLLAPYDAHHVERYHEWMQNDELREATASELLSLEEEYENQKSWRTAHDKLTFIVCLPLTNTTTPPPTTTDVVFAGESDAPARMVGDINLFLTPCEDDNDDDAETEGTRRENKEADNEDCDGEIDIMIAVPEHRGKGIGEAAVRAFLHFLARKHDGIMSEYAHAHIVDQRAGEGEGRRRGARLKRLVAKINAGNKGSIRLFENIGFQREGEPNFFNEICMVLADFSSVSLSLRGQSESEVPSPSEGGLGYREMVYDRSRLVK